MAHPRHWSIEVTPGHCTNMPPNHTRIAAKHSGALQRGIGMLRLQSVGSQLSKWLRLTFDFVLSVGASVATNFMLLPWVWGSNPKNYCLQVSGSAWSRLWCTKVQTSPCAMYVQYHGGCSVPWQIFSTVGAYHDSCGGIPWVVWGGIMSRVGDGGVRGMLLEGSGACFPGDF